MANATPFTAREPFSPFAPNVQPRVRPPANVTHQIA
jgi:hypothetical protein